ncbi:hypothetical protein O6H91_14G056000 [Diphasiastrum complanatum]|uniref:Uncharacterized protein n=1 Tax=Diphasiastrum complanatum TaxID=34168 RepID=A0ACC2BPR3_DIPCM|nr:hypothetical protein O6H91_14G056000 [Diphasiastrum complanatum]
MRYKFCQAGDCMSTGLYYCKNCYEQLKLSIPKPEKLICNSREGCDQNPSLHFCEDCHSRSLEELKKVQDNVNDKEETISRLKKKIELFEWRIQLSSKQDSERERQISSLKKQNQARKSQVELQLKEAEEQEAQLKALLKENEQKEARLQTLQQQSEESNHRIQLLLKEKYEADGKIGFLRKWQLEWGEKSASPSEIVLTAADGGALRANRSVLVGKSEVFRSMLTSDMISGTIGHIDLEDMNTPALIAFIRFLHIAELSPEELNVHAQSLFMAAHIYGVDLLKSICEDFLLKSISPENVFSYLEVGHRCNSKAIQDVSFQIISSQVPQLKLNEYWMALIKKYPEMSVNLSDYLLQKLQA